MQTDYQFVGQPDGGEHECAYDGTGAGHVSCDLWPLSRVIPLQYPAEQLSPLSALSKAVVCGPGVRAHPRNGVPDAGARVSIGGVWGHIWHPIAGEEWISRSDRITRHILVDLFSAVRAIHSLLNDENQSH